MELEVPKRSSGHDTLPHKTARIVICPLNPNRRGDYFPYSQHIQSVYHFLHHLPRHRKKRQDSRSRLRLSSRKIPRRSTWQALRHDNASEIGIAKVLIKVDLSVEFEFLLEKSTKNQKDLENILNKNKRLFSKRKKKECSSQWDRSSISQKKNIKKTDI